MTLLMAAALSFFPKSFGMTLSGKPGTTYFLVVMIDSMMYSRTVVALPLYFGSFSRFGAFVFSTSFGPTTPTAPWIPGMVWHAKHSALMKISLTGSSPVTTGAPGAGPAGAAPGAPAGLGHSDCGMNFLYAFSISSGVGGSIPSRANSHVSTAINSSKDSAIGGLWIAGMGLSRSFDPFTPKPATT